MLRLPILIAVVVSLAVPAIASRTPQLTRTPPRLAASHPDVDFVPNEVVVKFRSNASAAKAAALQASFGLVREERLAGLGIERYEIAGGGDVLDMVRRVRDLPDVEFAEPNYLSVSGGSTE